MIDELWNDPGSLHPAKPLGYVLHFLVGPAFAAQTLAAHLAYGTLVGGFFSSAG